jgi:hypothetical protein
VVAVGVLASAGGSRAESECPSIPVYAKGRVARYLCPQEAAGQRLTVVDLSDGWAPLLFSETPDHPQPYRRTLVALANEQLGEGAAWATAQEDRYFELFGIFPTISVVKRRLSDRERHACHAGIDDEALRQLRRTIAPWTASPKAKPEVRDALAVVQRHLRCEGLLRGPAKEGIFDEPTREALAVYQRRHMLPSAAILDEETRSALLTDSRELDFRSLLRSLRERVVDATGLIEDGSAANAWAPVLGRFIDSAEYRQVLRAAPLPSGAPDLVDRATTAAAEALGWTSAEGATRALAELASPAVALELPPEPAYRARPLRIRAEIDRGDVWTSYPFDANGQPRPSPAKNRPTFTLLAETEGGEIPLVRWATTIGSWKAEKEDDEEHLAYKASPVGRRYWRDLLVAPTWLPPPTTPDRELARRRASGWVADEQAIGPGYRSAYGLVALLHLQAVATGSSIEFADAQIRTHGSGNYRSILRGASHGCHRLFNHLAVRLGSFLLAHHAVVRHGKVDVRYERVLHWKGHRLKLRAESRGYRYELVPPVQVDVLSGRIVRSRSSTH